MGTVTKTIGSGTGRDYSTPQAWADALPSNLVTDGNSQVGNFYADSEFNFTTTFSSLLTLSGHTTDATHTITFQAAPGQSHVDNAGVQSNAFCYNPANGAALKVSGGYSKVISGSDAVFINRLQLLNSSAANSNEVFSNTLFGGTFHLSQLIVEHTAPASRGSSLTNGDATNCIFIQRSNIPAIYTEYHAFAFVNCGFISPSDVGNTHAAVHASGHATPSFVNCFFFGFSGGAVDSGGTPTGNHNATDLSSVGFGSNNVTSLVFADQFQNVLNTTRDFRLKSGSGLIEAGQSVGTNGVPAIDAVGTARPQGTVPDIGPWEFVQASGVTLSGSSSEAGDAASASARVRLTGTAAVSEQGDALTGAVLGAPHAVLALAEAGDAAAGTISAAISAMAAALDGADGAAAHGAVLIAARTAFQDGDDLTAGTARAAIAGAAACIETPDSAAARAVHVAAITVDTHFLLVVRARVRLVAAPTRARTLRPQARVRTLLPIKRA